MSDSAKLGLSLLIYAVTACGGGRLSGIPPRQSNEQQGPASHLVPAVSPDTQPAWIYDDTSIVTAPNRPGPFIKNLVLVLFSPNAPQEQRQAAIDSVKGVVVGGVRLNSRDGLYLVALRDDPTQAFLFRALGILAGMPGVSSALPDYVFVPSRY